MIRAFILDDLEAVASLWLTVNMEAHDFIPATYWRGQYEGVKGLLPGSELYVAQEDGEIVGFIGLNQGHIEGLFVLKQQRGQGIGRALLAYGQKKYDMLTLHVYVKNVRAVAFYKKSGFYRETTCRDENMGEREIAMRWRKV